MVLEGTFFWEIADIPAMLKFTSDARRPASNNRPRFGIPFVFESGCRLVSGEDDREFSGKPQDTCEYV